MGTKPFLSIEDQIQKLKDRNLKFNDEITAKKILLRENYYNVINGYKLPFIKKDLQGKSSIPESYIENCEFSEIYALHNLDRELRIIILRVLLKFETHLKTSCAYNYSKKFPETYSYLNVKNYSSEKDDLQVVLKNLAALSASINRNKNTLYIGHYIDNHESVPLWVLVNSLTLGNMSYFYNSIDLDLRNIVAKDFSIQYKEEYSSNEKIESGELKQIIRVINLFRNACAHEEILFLFKLKSSIKGSLFKKYFDDERITVKLIGKSNLFTLILLLRLVTLKNDYLDLIETIKRLFEEYSPLFKAVSFNDIIELSGFIDGWKEMTEIEV